MMTGADSVAAHEGVNFGPPRSFGTVLKPKLKETFLPDDPFGHLKNEPSYLLRTKKAIQNFVPILEWLPNYSFSLFKYDLLAGLTIASLAIPQGISYAKLGKIPPIIGLYSSFVPPLVYAVFGSSKHLAVGTVAASSLLIAATIEEKVTPAENPELFVSLVFTTCFVSGLLQTTLGACRLGILVDFLSHSTITGFMGGTAVLICLQQLKDMLGMKHFTTHTDMVSVLRVVFRSRKEWRWECAVVGIIFLVFLQSTKILKQKRPRLFWVSAVAPILIVLVGDLFAYLSHAENHGIAIVGQLKKGINPPSIKRLTFDRRYISGPLKAGSITAMIASAEGIAIGRSFAMMTNERTDGNKEMLAFGFMNIVGSFTSCYLTTGPFSKTAVNFNAGCRTPMSNIVMAICMMLTLVFLAPLFSHTPLVALEAVIMSAMFGLIEYEKAYHLYKTDKFDFLVCMAGFFGVAFISMDVGLLLSVGLSLIRALLYVARPATCKLGNIPGSNLYRDVQQYPNAILHPGILAIKLGSPIYYSNCNHIRERILRYIREEQSLVTSKGNNLEYLVLHLGDVTSIDITGVETLNEIRKILLSKDIKMIIVNPRLAVMEKLLVTRLIETIGKECVFLSMEHAVDACKLSFTSANKTTDDAVQVTIH